MGWGFEIVRMSAAAALGAMAGVLLSKAGRTARDRLLDSYSDYFASIIAVVFEDDVATAAAALQRVARATQRLELLESQREAIVATGMLFVKCNRLVSVMKGDDAKTGAISRLRTEISAEYWNVVDMARKRLGVESFVPPGLSLNP